LQWRPVAKSGVGNVTYAIYNHQDDFVRQIAVGVLLSLLLLPHLAPM
jgi:hypothetical protein